MFGKQTQKTAFGVILIVFTLYIRPQEAVDNQGGELRKELTEEQKEELNVALRRLSPDHVELVLMQIYQCIMLHLIVHSDDENFASPDNYE